MTNEATNERTGKPCGSIWLVGLLAFLLGACSGGSSRKTNGDPPRPTVGNVLAYPFEGAKSVLMIIVKYNDAAALFPETTEGENQVLTIRDEVIDALDRDSYGKLKLSIDYTWPPILIDKSLGDYSAETGMVHARADAIAAAKAAGYAVDSYDREVLFSADVWSGAARGWIRTAWMPHRLRWVLVHEIGHTLSRGHANFWNGDPLDTSGPRINNEEYGDLYDPMGTGELWSRFLHSGPWFKLRAGWLTDTEVMTVTTSGTYTLSPLEAPDAIVGPAALRIRRDAQYDYWLFHRSTEPDVSDGPVIVKTPTNPYDPTLLLDMNRGTVGPEASDAALGRGQIFDDSAYAGIVVENVTPAPGGAIVLDITVDENRQTTMDLLPEIEVLSPTRDAGPVSGVVDFSVLAHDQDTGPTDGEGIVKVTLSLLLQAIDTAPVIASTELTEPPYEWSFDTGALMDTTYYLSVTAESTDGGSNVIWYRFLVDNYTPTLP